MQDPESVMENQANSEEVIKIVNPERVQRILTRVFGAHLEVLIRTQKNPNIAVRGKAHIYIEDGPTPQVVITDISEEGHRFLSQVNDLRVEFIGMATQIVFFARKISLSPRSISLTRPKELLSLDRRESARLAINAKNACYMQLSLWTSQARDFTSPPHVRLYSDLASHILLADISEGGVCGFTRFPGVLESVDRGMHDQNALLFLPMQASMTIPVEIRWVRRVKESKKNGAETRHQRFFRIGIQFSGLEDNQRLLIKQYMQQLTVSEAI